jgi:hypothetical protein
MVRRMTRTLATAAALVLSLALPVPGQAQSAMTGAEFEAYVTGRTLTFAENGFVYGIEEYLSNRRVRWAFIEDECQEGYWYETQIDGGPMICFVYENAPDNHQCWTFFQSARGLKARFMNDPNARELYEVQQSREPMICLGPRVGS